jgi:hypothetical protein
VAADRFVDPRELVRINLVGVRDDDRAGPRQPPQRLAQQAARQDVAVPERLRRVHEHDVEVPRDAPVLERVVEHERRHLRPLPQHVRGRREAVRIGPEQHAVALAWRVEAAVEHQQLVAELAGRRPVAARQNRHHPSPAPAAFRPATARPASCRCRRS